MPDTMTVGLCSTLSGRLSRWVAFTTVKDDTASYIVHQLEDIADTDEPMRWQEMALAYKGLAEQVVTAEDVDLGIDTTSLLRF